MSIISLLTVIERAFAVPLPILAMGTISLSIFHRHMSSDLPILGAMYSFNAMHLAQCLIILGSCFCPWESGAELKVEPKVPAMSSQVANGALPQAKSQLRMLRQSNEQWWLCFELSS
jgi:hypothetical protein